MPLQPDEYRAIHAVADRAEPRLEQEIYRALSRRLDDAYVEGAMSVLDEALLELHLIGQAAGAVYALTGKRVRKAFFEDIIGEDRDAFDAWLAEQGETLPESILDALRDRDRRASEYSDRRISNVLRKALNDETGAVLQMEGILGVSRERVREMMRGLTEQQRGALETQVRERSREVARDELDDEVDPETARQRAEQVAADAAERSDRMRRWRAQRIARTETMRALNSGMESSWQRLAEQGEIDGRRAVKTWRVTFDQRLCRVCRPLDDKQRRLGSKFGPLRAGFGFLLGPPAHPNCRCVLDLEFAEIGDVRKEA